MSWMRTLWGRIESQMTIKNSVTPEPHRQWLSACAAVIVLVCLGCEKQSRPVVEAEPGQNAEAADAAAEGSPGQSTAERIEDEVETRRESWPDGSSKSEKRVKWIHGAFIDHGPWTLWYENGQIQAQGEYVDGKLDGVYQEWYDNGQLRARGHYSKGSKEDLFILWDLQGAKTHEWHYVANKQHGMRTIWYPNGRMKSQVKFIDGRMHGKLVEWDEEGQITKEVIYVNGTRAP